MPRVHTTKTNFSKGEISPLALMRADTGAYQDGLATAENAMLLTHGGLRRRPGTKWIAQMTGLGQGTVRLETFYYGPSQAYLFVFYHQGARVYTTDGSMVTQFSGSKWSDNMLPRLSITQAGNVMIVAHPDMVPQVIRRTGSTSFSVTDFVWQNGTSNPITAPSLQPFHKFFDTEGVTIQPSAYTGTSITVTAGAALFTGLWVGKILRYAGTEIAITGYTNASTLEGNCREELAKAYDYPVTSSTAFLVGQRVKSTAGDAEGVIVSKPDGTHIRVLMLDRADAFEYDATILRYLVSGTTSSKLTGAGSLVATPPATLEWDENAFSIDRGWPNTVCFHEQRLIIGGSKTLANRLWFTAVGDYFAFDEGLGEADSAFTVEVVQVSEIRHMISHRHLAVFTDGGEFYVPQGESNPLTALSISVRRQTRYGCSYVRPVVFDGSIFFADLSGQSIREFLYTDQETAYASFPASVLSGHLIKQPVDMDVQVGADSNEEQYVFVVNTDGTMAVHHGLRREELSGWTPWSTQGKFKRVRVVDGFVFVAVEREINGVAELYLEMLDWDLTLDSARFVEDGGNDYGILSLKKMHVHALNGLSYLGSWDTDIDGTPLPGPLPYPVSNVWLGLDYPCRVKTLPVVNVGGQNVGNIPKRITKAAVRIHESVTFTIQGQTLAVYNVTDDIGAAPNPKTGMFEFRLLGWTDAAQLEITQVYPLPLTMLGIQLEVSF